ncbi:MAG: hypothetical protein L0216_21755, partial [Planctomycetales bacterium]|nr:hypothetical protein [Planctomycetales bacterium]
MKTSGTLAAGALVCLAAGGCATGIESSGRNPRLVASLEATDWGEERPLRLSEYRDGTSAPAPEAGGEPRRAVAAAGARPASARQVPSSPSSAYRREAAARRPARPLPAPLVVQAERTAAAAARRETPPAAPAAAAPALVPAPPAPMAPVVARAPEA